MDPIPKLAVITGASSGIGRAIALAMGKRGCRLFLIGRNPSRLSAVARAVSKVAAAVFPCQADLTDPAARAEIVREVDECHGGVHLLVHSAGIICFDRDETATQEAINFLAPRELTELLLPQLIKHRGEIVFVNSSAVLREQTGSSEYVKSKQKLKHYAEELRQSVNPQGVRVLSIYPGRTATPMQSRVFDEEGVPYTPELLLQPEDIAGMVVAAVELPRTAEVTDIMIRPMNKI